MITKLVPLSMTEALEYIKKEQEKDAEIRKFIEKFVKINPEKARVLKQDLEKMNLIKMKPEDLAKIIDTLPEDSENLNKIFNDISLDEDESKKILQTIKENK